MARFTLALSLTLALGQRRLQRAGVRGHQRQQLLDVPFDLTSLHGCALAGDLAASSDGGYA